MPVAVAMPRLGMQMREGTLVQWHARPGEAVEKGRPLLVIESDKAEVDVEAPASGFLRHVYVAPGETVPCGALLGVLTEGADEPFDAEAFRAARAPVAPVAPVSPPARPAAAPAPALAVGPAARAAGSAGAGSPVTPAARRRARERGVDPDTLGRLGIGSGPGGRVLREDVDAFADRLAGRVEVAPGVALEVVEAGAGPPLLLLPGFGSDAASFARVVPGLAARFRTRVLHPRGTGLSAAPPGSAHDVAEAARDAAALLEDAPAPVLGASLGAAVALELALRRPDRVSALVLVTPLAAPSPRLAAVLECWVRLAAAAEPSLAAAALLPWLFSARTLARPGPCAAARRGLEEMLRRAGPAGAPALAATARAVAAHAPPGPETLARLRMPTLVLEAGDDLLTGPADALAAGIPGARRVRVEAAGHALLLEAPEEALAAISAHLA